MKFQETIKRQRWKQNILGAHTGWTSGVSESAGLTAEPADTDEDDAVIGVSHPVTVLSVLTLAQGSASGTKYTYWHVYGLIMHRRALFGCVADVHICIYFVFFQVVSVANVYRSSLVQKKTN